MGVIRVLPEFIANKIAAGEVVERPASVVKELIENALDAGAAAVDVTIENGGKNLIRVSDDGCGMSAEDAKTAFQRHATSKISTLQDLDRIGSYGFRGEALPSIAAVSRLRLITRPEGAAHGAQVVIEGGNFRAVLEFPCAQGTTVEVRDLFFNTPARRKFLKSPSTEVGHILDTVSHLALPALGVRFTLKVDGKTLLDLTPAKELRARAAEILGEDTERELMEVNSGEGIVRISGLIGKPILTRANRSGIQLFVNRRWVKSTPLTYAILAGYHGFLMHGRFPAAVLFIELDLSRVDVNVHPTKQEVRISREQDVVEFIKASVRGCLGGAATLAPRLAVPAAATGPQAKSYTLSNSATTRVKEPRPEPAPSFDGFNQPSVVTAQAPVTLGEPVILRDSLKITRILGQIHQTFIVAETQEGYMIVDQHAAHERIIFEALMKNLTSGAAERQTLLLDEVLELHQRQLQLFKKAHPLLTKLGFEIEEFGERTYVVRAYPAALGEVNPAGLIRTFLEEQEEGKLRTILEDQTEMVAALCACKKSSVKARDSLAPQAVRALLERLAACQNPFSCPHGRPVFFTQTFSELERQFKRV